MSSQSDHIATSVIADHEENCMDHSLGCGCRSVLELPQRSFRMTPLQSQE